MATFQTTVNVPELSEAALESWHVFLAILGPNEIGPHIGPTSAAFVSSWPSLSSAGRALVLQSLEYIVMEVGSRLGNYLDDIVDLSTVPELHAIHQRLKELRKDWTPKDHLQRILDRSSSVNLSVAILSLGELKTFMLNEQDFIRKLASGDIFDPMVGQIVATLLAAACRDSDVACVSAGRKERGGNAGHRSAARDSPKRAAVRFRSMILPAAIATASGGGQAHADAVATARPEGGPLPGQDGRAQQPADGLRLRLGVALGGVYGMTSRAPSNTEGAMALSPTLHVDLGLQISPRASVYLRGEAGTIHRGDTIEPSQARLLKATFFEFVIDDSPIVDPDRAGVELSGDTERAVDIARPDAGAEPIFTVVGELDGIAL